MGRPALPETRLRAVQVSCRVTEIEAGMIDLAAEAAEMGRAAWMRQTLKAAANRSRRN